MIYDLKPWLKFYDPWVLPEIDIPAVTLKDAAETTVKAFPDRPAFHFLDETWTYRELSEKADRFAAALSEHGIGKGDVLAIHLPNSPQYLMAILGALKSGAIVSGLSPLLVPDEIAHQLSDVGAKAVITLDSLFEERLAGLADKLDFLALVIVTAPHDFVSTEEGHIHKPANLNGTEVVGLRELLSRAAVDPPEVAVEPGDVCFIQYTGGTTGMPKGAMLTHYNMVANVTQCGTWLRTEMGAEVMLCAFPMFHIAGLFHVAQALVFAFTQVIIPDPRDTGNIIRQMRRHRPTFLANVPSLAIMLLKEREFRELDFSRLQICMFGAAPFPREKVNELEKVLGANKLMEVFGMTEASPLLTSNPRDGLKKTGSIGIPLPSTRLRLVDLETGDMAVPQGEEGEIIASGPQVMAGYRNQPEETRRALREHGGAVWMHTGDVAVMDEDGFFFIVDRAKDMINVGGYKVFSTDVEHKLSGHPAIELCALVSAINPERPGSELVKLVVQKSHSHRGRPDEDIRDDLLAFARQKLAPYKVPKIIEFVESMPLTPVGKVDKKVLRKQ